jgi:putative ABC transport system ATP-binding protein
MTTTTTTDVAARADAATKVYGTGDAAVRALDEIDVAIPARRLTAIMGASGSGKSTLLHCMAGLDTLTSGRVVIGDQDLAALDDQALTILRRERIGFVFQAFNLVPTMTARANITLPFTLGGRRADPDWFDEVVGAVGIGDRLGHRPAELSGGQQQRVAIARAFVTRPDIIFADEPTGNLDSRSGAEVLALLRGAVDRFGQTVAMVTHDPVAASHADSVLVLADGRVVDHLDQPTPERVLDRIMVTGG